MKATARWLAALLIAGCACEPDVAAPTVIAPVPAPLEVPTTPPICIDAILVAWQGAAGASTSVTLSEEDARARAEDFLAQLDVGADFGTLAATESDHAPSRARRGLVGTWSAGQWPAPFGELEERFARLGPFETSEVLRTRGGWVIAHRGPTDLRRTRHILVRVAGGAGAGAEITRTRDQALASAAEVRRQIVEDHADFASLARVHSDDERTAATGGDQGLLGRGRLSAAYEAISYQLALDEISEPIETDEGFEVIQLLEAPPTLL